MADCPLGEDCDLTLAYMAGAKDAKDTITRLRAENAKLRAALGKADACIVVGAKDQARAVSAAALTSEKEKSND